MDNDNTQSSCGPPRVCQRHGPHVRHLLQIVLLPNQLRDLRIAPLPFHMLPQKFSPQWTQTRQSLIKPTNESWVMKENRGGGGKGHMNIPVVGWGGSRRGSVLVRALFHSL